MLIIKCQEYYDTVIKWASKHGVLEEFMDKIEYLQSYGTKCSEPLPHITQEDLEQYHLKGAPHIPASAGGCPPDELFYRHWVDEERCRVTMYADRAPMSFGLTWEFKDKNDVYQHWASGAMILHGYKDSSQIALCVDTSGREGLHWGIHQ